MNGLACGISTTGFRWNLIDEDLAPWVSRGVSNEMVDAEAEVILDEGTLIVIQPRAYLSHSPSNGETR